MSRVVFLLEERSMEVLLKGMLPRLLPGLPFLCVTFEGKNDLERNIARKLRAWREPGVRFVVIRDNDGGDCRAQKQALASLCEDGGRADTLVRIPCQELEAWYLGDPEALAVAFGDRRLRGIGAKERLRDPDAVTRPSRALAELVPEYQKIAGARRLAPHLTPDRNSSRSIQIFVAGVARLAAEVAADSLRR